MCRLCLLQDQHNSNDRRIHLSFEVEAVGPRAFVIQAEPHDFCQPPAELQGCKLAPRTPDVRLGAIDRDRSKILLIGLVRFRQFA